MRLGIDLVEIERIRKMAEKWGDHFLRRVFSENEIAYSFRYRDPWPHLAARFAAKEALVKALGKFFPFRDASLEPDENGRPIMHFSGRLQKIASDLGIGSAEVSLSHTQTLAIAIVAIV